MITFLWEQYDISVHIFFSFFFSTLIYYIVIISGHLDIFVMKIQILSSVCFELYRIVNHNSPTVTKTNTNFSIVENCLAIKKDKMEFLMWNTFARKSLTF